MEWTPLAAAFAGMPRQFSQPISSLDPVHLIAQDTNWYSLGSYSYPNGSSTATFKVIDDPSVFCQSRPMAAAMQFPIRFANSSGLPWAPVVGEMDLRLCTDAARTSGVYCRVKRYTLPPKLYWGGDSYSSILADTIPASRIELTDAFPFLGSPDVSANSANSVAAWPIATEISYGIIGQSPIATMAMDLYTAAYHAETQSSLGVTLAIELGVYQPPGVSQSIAYVTERTRPHQWCKTFTAPSYRQTGEVFSRSYATLSLTGYATQTEAVTIQPPRSDSASVSAPLFPISLYRGWVSRRSVEFDCGEVARISGSQDFRRGSGADSDTEGRVKGAGNAIRQTSYLATVSDTITNQHRTRFTKGLFGAPVTNAQNHWPALGTSRNGGATIKINNQSFYNAGKRTAVIGHTFRLGKTVARGTSLAPNSAAGLQENIGTTAYVWPQDMTVEGESWKSAYAASHPPAFQGETVWQAIAVSDWDAFVALWEAAIDSHSATITIPFVTGASGGTPVAEGWSYPFPAYRTWDQLKYERAGAESFLTVYEATERQSSPVVAITDNAPVTFAGTNADALIATSGGVSANRQGATVGVLKYNPQTYITASGKVTALTTKSRIGRAYKTALFKSSEYTYPSGGLIAAMAGKRCVDAQTRTLRYTVSDVSPQEKVAFSLETFTLNVKLTAAQTATLNSGATLTIPYAANRLELTGGIERSGVIDPTGANPNIANTTVEITIL